MEVLGIVLLVAIGGLSATIVVVGIVAGIWDWVLGIRYLKYNNNSVSCGLTGRELAEKLLKINGLTNVTVKKCGFWRAFIVLWGNSYSRKKKTIFLRKSIIDVASITAVSLAAQKVALAIQDSVGDKDYLHRWRYEISTVISAVSFIPIILIGFLVDWLIFAQLGVVSIVVSLLALALLGYAIFGECMLLKSEDKANAKGIELLVQNDFVDDAEVLVVRKIYKTYLTRHILQFIISILQFVKVALQILWEVLKSKK